MTESTVVLKGGIVTLLAKLRGRRGEEPLRMRPATAKQNKHVQRLAELGLVRLVGAGVPQLTPEGLRAGTDAVRWGTDTKNAEACLGFTPAERDALISAAWDAIEALSEGDALPIERTVRIVAPASSKGPECAYVLDNTHESLLSFCRKLGQRPFVHVQTNTVNNKGAVSGGLPGALLDQAAVTKAGQPAAGAPEESASSSAQNGNGSQRQGVAPGERIALASPGASGAPEAPHLDLFTQTLRPYQQDLVEDALAFVERAQSLPDDAPEAARRILYSAPTGSGKGSCELGLLVALRSRGLNAWILTPSLEVIRGFLERTGCSADELRTATAETLAALGERVYVTTPTRYRNRVLTGDRDVPEVVLYDEVHHAIEGNDVSGTLFALAPWAAWVGFTATPYRGNPKSTADLEAAWPEQVEVLSIPEAVECGAWALPTFEVVGLVDDDAVKVVGGDFQAKAAGKAVGSRIEDLAALTRQRFVSSEPVVRLPAGVDQHVAAHCAVEPFPVRGDWLPACNRMPTAVTVPSREAGGLLVEALDRLRVDAVLVTADTKAKDRAAAYDACRECRAVLVSVRVVSEGVDLPWLRRLVDARPTMSPVSWIQQLGRITRPGKRRPEYLCVCRNLERHAYLLGGLVPRRKVAEAQEEFDKPSKRAGQRSIGLESLSRFKAIELHLAGGVKGAMYALHSVDAETGAVTEWASLLDPTSERVVTARRVNALRTHDEEGEELPAPERTYGKWVEAPLPPDLTGYATSKFRGKATQKQRTWWERSAAHFGLDPDAADEITARTFSALPVLVDLRTNLAGA